MEQIRKRLIDCAFREDRHNLEIMSFINEAGLLGVTRDELQKKFVHCDEDEEDLDIRINILVAKKIVHFTDYFGLVGRIYYLYPYVSKLLQSIDMVCSLKQTFKKFVIKGYITSYIGLDEEDPGKTVCELSTSDILSPAGGMYEDISITSNKENDIANVRDSAEEMFWHLAPSWLSRDSVEFEYSVDKYDPDFDDEPF